MATPSTQSQPGLPGAQQRKGPVLIATNTVTTKDGLTVRARIDPTLVSYAILDVSRWD